MARGRRRGIHRGRSRSGRFTKRSGGFRRGGSSPRTRTVYRTRSVPTKRRGRSIGSKRRASNGRALGLLFGGAVSVGLASVANTSGLLELVPVQKKIGLSLVGVVGLVALATARWLFSTPSWKDAGYTVGVAFVLYELQRQIENRFIDFKALFLPAAVVAVEKAKLVEAKKAELSVKGASAITGGPLGGAGPVGGGGGWVAKNQPDMGAGVPMVREFTLL